MSHSFISCYIHYIFTTKNRQDWITPELQEKLWPYLGGIARKEHMQALAIGGIENHVHALIALPSTHSVSKAIQILKGGSSRWIHKNFLLWIILHGKKAMGLSA